MAPSADDIIDGYKQLIARAHVYGMRHHRRHPEKAPLFVLCAARISRSTAIAMIPLIVYYESAYLAARRLYQIREFAQPNTHVLYLIHQTLSLEENIYEILFQAQSWAVRLGKNSRGVGQHDGSASS
jgi:predicted protein tyrosine phosphatase